MELDYGTFEEEVVRHVYSKYLRMAIIALMLSACVNNQTGKDVAGAHQIAGNLGESINSISQSLLSKNEIWGRRYYQMDQNHVCGSEGGNAKFPFRRAIELSVDKQVFDLGDPCQPQTQALSKPGVLEASYDGLLIGYFDGLFQYSASAPSESDSYVEAWCNRSLVSDVGEVSPIDLRVKTGSQIGEALLAWVMVSPKYTSVIAENISMMRSQNSSARVYSAVGQASILEVGLSADSAKQNLYPSQYKMSGDQGAEISFYCRLAR